LRGDAAQQQPSGSSLAVMSGDDKVEAVLVAVVEQHALGLVASQDLVLDADTGALRTITDVGECLGEVPAGRLGGLGAVGLGLSMRG
jgi:hypothetical protein